jgi:hypothetical protein
MIIAMAMLLLIILNYDGGGDACPYLWGLGA